MFGPKIKIIIEKHDETHFHVYIKGHSVKCADGNSSSDALGTLLLEHPNDFGISTIEVVGDKIKEHKKPPSGGLFGGLIENTNPGSSL
jgi:hypothetical protein